MGKRVALLGDLLVLEQNFEEVVVVIVDCVVGGLDYVELLQDVVKLPSIGLV